MRDRSRRGRRDVRHGPIGDDRTTHAGFLDARRTVPCRSVGAVTVPRRAPGDCRTRLLSWRTWMDGLSTARSTAPPVRSGGASSGPSTGRPSCCCTGRRSRRTCGGAPRGRSRGVIGCTCGTCPGSGRRRCGRGRTCRWPRRRGSSANSSGTGGWSGPPSSRTTSGVRGAARDAAARGAVRAAGAGGSGGARAVGLAHVPAARRTRRRLRAVAAGTAPGARAGVRRLGQPPGSARGHPGRDGGAVVHGGRTGRLLPADRAERPAFHRRDRGPVRGVGPAGADLLGRGGHLDPAGEGAAARGAGPRGRAASDRGRGPSRTGGRPAELTLALGDFLRTAP